MINYIKNNYKNLYIILVSFMIGLWFNGISKLVHYVFPHKNISEILILLFVPVVFFYIDDNSLSELYNLNNDDTNKNKNIISPIISSDYMHLNK